MHLKHSIHVLSAIAVIIEAQQTTRLNDIVLDAIDDHDEGLRTINKEVCFTEYVLLGV